MGQIKIPQKKGIFGLYLIARNAIFSGKMASNKMIMLFEFRKTLLLAIILPLISFQFTAFCQTTLNHRITVKVDQITKINVNPPSISLDIPNGPTAVVIAGQDQMTVTDQTTLLIWGTNSSNRKITLRTNLSPQKYSVLAYAVNPTAGVAWIETPLSTTDNNFITGVGKSSGHANVRYTGVVSASLGIGSDAHSLTFTITSE